MSGPSLILILSGLILFFFEKMNIKRHNLGKGGRREALRTWEIVRERGYKYVDD